MEATKLNTYKKAIAGVAILIAASPVFAQAAGMSGLCLLYAYLMTAVGVIALLAGVVIVINSFWSKNSAIGEIVQTVLIGCILIGLLAAIVSKALGTNVSC